MKFRLFLFGLALAHSISADGDSSLPFNIEPITAFDEPWAMAFLPDNRMLVTGEKGQLPLVDQAGEKSPSTEYQMSVAVTRRSWRRRTTPAFRRKLCCLSKLC